MDQTTHIVRRNYWAGIIAASNNRPKNTSVSQWLTENGIKAKSYYYWLRKFRKEAFEAADDSDKQSIVPKGSAFAEIKPASSSYETETDSSFVPNAVIKSGMFTIALSNGTSDSLVKSIVEAISHAC